ncbi:hypothetical protein LUW74_12530 [Actinomadura madurae]|uniref:hypothetical protein n=1 Tax=Actinomadura madurae TaxID=1993 RepID=UPI0020275A3C|nr:hypothetical protein [Actinomadura madurae]URN04075.1 hypothetical protein LUW74_12530 [Actinomadura madurae]
MFTFPVDPQELFHERARQFTGHGVPADAVGRARTAIGDTWGTGPDGWVPVWAAWPSRRPWPSA